MRVLQVIQELGTGGAEQVVRSLLADAERHGDLVAVACSAPAVLPAGAVHVPLPMLLRRPLLVPVAAMRVARAARRHRVEVVHCHNPGMALVGALATLRGRRPAALVTDHGVPPADEARTARLLRRSGVAVVACGPGVAASLEEHGCPVAGTVLNGIAAPPPPADRAALLASWDLPPGMPLVVAAGRLVAQKRHDLVLRAAVALPGVAVVVLGEGPLRADLLALAARLGVADRIVMAGSRADARAILGAADCVVQPSDWEGLPLVVLEAMAAGRVVVGTAVRGIRELVRDGEDGLLVAAGDDAALASAVRRVLGDPDLARRLGESARRRGLADFGEAAMTAAYAALYEEAALARR